MNKEEQALQVSQLISYVPGLDSFLISNGDIRDFKQVLSMFKTHLKESNQYSTEIDLMLNIVVEKYESIIESSDDGSGIFYISKHLTIDDSDLISQFLQDKLKCTNKNHKFKNTNRQHYKTITEKIAYREVDYNSILERYKNCDHPYICSQIAIPYCEAKQYHIGLAFLNKALKHVFSSPNIYWHNPYGVLGCAEAIFELQYLMGVKGMMNSPHLGLYELLSCVYLYISRVIHMYDNEVEEVSEGQIPLSVINKINYLSIRADLVLDFRKYFMDIFGLGINPDIQYISDKAIANELGKQYGIDIITIQAFKDAMKMYRHASMVPNYTGGYLEIEDATFGELIKRGQYRSIELAKQLFNYYRNGDYRLNKEELDDTMVELWNKLHS